MNNSLFDEYNRYHPEFMVSLKVFPEDIRKKIIKRLKNENDRNNFRSAVGEIRFGKLFNELGFQIEYDKKFPNNQRPDWVLKLGNSKAICDVYRLGKSERDQVRDDFENQLIERLEEIPQNYFLEITFIDEYFDSEFYSVALIAKEIRDWLVSSPKEVGEKFSVQDTFEFEIIKTGTDVTNVCCLGNLGSIEMKSHKIRQPKNLSPNEISKKLHKYDSIIFEYQMPFFICVYIDFGSGFKHRDFEDNFLGRGVQFIHFGTPLANTEQFRHMGQAWTELGEFYNNLQLSGIITFFNEHFRLLLNPNKKQMIYDNMNLSLFSKLEPIAADKIQP